MLRIAIAGAGMVSRHHLRAWQSMADGRVVAIADPDRARAQHRAVEFGIGAVFSDSGEMLDAVRPDAIDIAAGHAAHRSLCLTAAERGIAILCQKPLAPSLAEANAIVAAVADRVRLMVHENWRFRPWYRRALEWVASGAIGAPGRLELGTRSSGFLLCAGKRPALERQPMLAAVERLMIGEVLVHHLDVACCLVGPLAVTEASIRHAIADVRGETAARIGLAGERVVAELSGDLACPGAPFPLTDALRLAGATGEIALAGNILTLAGEVSRQMEFDLDAGYQGSYDAAIGHFADALLHDSPFETTPEAHLRVLALAEDAYRAADPTA
jgi:predicted dehydrogenase